MPDGVRYHIIQADKEGCPPIPDLTFDDPAEAAKTAKLLGRERQEKLMVKIVVNPLWRNREKDRMVDGTYRRMPWYAHDWWRSEQAVAIHRNHFAHPSLERAGWVAYTKDDEDGTQDKQTIVRAGAYLKKYFSRVLHYYGVSERQLVTQFMLEYGPLDVNFAATEDDIISVYEHGPETCMVGREWPHDGRNPSYIYAAGDLQVAYLGDLEECSARAVVWPAKKKFSRVYGDVARLTKGLERLGYSWGAPIGAKIKRVMINEVVFDPQQGVPSECFIAPYIDKTNQRGGGHLSAIDKGDHLEICPEGTLGSHHCGGANGMTGHYVPREDEYPTFTCENCGVGGHRQLLPVHLDTQEEEIQDWCPKCCNRGTFHCGYSGFHFKNGTVQPVMVDGNIWAKYYANMYSTRCEMTGKRCREGSTYELTFMDDTVKQVCREWADQQGGVARSSISGRIYLSRDTVRVYDRKETHRAGIPELKYLAFQCDGCDVYSMISERTQVHGDDRLFCKGCVTAITEYGEQRKSPSRRAFEANGNKWPAPQLPAIPKPHRAALDPEQEPAMPPDFAVMVAPPGLYPGGAGDAILAAPRAQYHAYLEAAQQAAPQMVQIRRRD